jgi:hypothetical protein
MDQLNAGGGGAPPAAAAAAAAPQVKVSATAITRFTGTKGTMEVVSFVHQLESLQTSNNQTDAAVAETAANLFMDPSPAKAWYQVLMLEQDPDIKKWDGGLKAKLLTRYCTTQTLAEFAQMKAKLVQSQGETAEVFLDRVKLAWLIRDYSLANGVKAEAGYKTAMDRDIKESFLRGLRQIIKDKMAASNFETDSLQALVAAAKRAEENMAFDNRSALGAAAIDEGTNWYGYAEEEQACAFRQQGGPRGGGRGGGGRGGGAGRGGGRGGGYTRGGGGRNGDQSRKPKIECPRCGLYGTHGYEPANCYADLKQLEQKGKGKFERNGGGRGGGAARGGGRGGGYGYVSGVDHGEDEYSVDPYGQLKE